MLQPQGENNRLSLPCGYEQVKTGMCSGLDARRAGRGLHRHRTCPCLLLWHWPQSCVHLHVGLWGLLGAFGLKGEVFGGGGLRQVGMGPLGPGDLARRHSGSWKRAWAQTLLLGDKGQLGISCDSQMWSHLISKSSTVIQLHGAESRPS